MTGSIEMVALAVGLFVGSHLVLSAGPVRAPLVHLVGERIFLVLYSIVALILIVWVARAYGAAPYVEIWSPPTGMRHLSLTLMPVAFILLVGGLSTPNPSAAGVDGAKLARRGPQGILKVTRHPVMWSFGLWGLLHLLANGDAASMLLFGGMTVLALGGALAIDAKKRARLGSAWGDFEAETSFLPFAAIIEKRTPFSLREIGYARLAGGLVLYVVMLVVHPWLFGVDPWPL